MKKTLVLGASTKAERYSNKAIKKLLANDIEVVAVGNKEGEVDGVSILKGAPDFQQLHTITLYLSATNQKDLYGYILGLKPKRIIFNPGAENPELADMAERNGIEVQEACTLVMLSIGNY